MILDVTVPQQSILYTSLVGKGLKHTLRYSQPVLWLQTDPETLAITDSPSMATSTVNLMTVKCFYNTSSMNFVTSYTVSLITTHKD